MNLYELQTQYSSTLLFHLLRIVLTELWTPRPNNDFIFLFVTKSMQRPAYQTAHPLHQNCTLKKHYIAATGW
jgi:hypothetical protein